MARGGYGGGGLPLHARHRAEEPRPEPAPAVQPAAGPACPARHCWVRAPADGGPPRPGLLLEWRKDEDGRWLGRVVYPAELRAGRWATVDEWLPAELLSTA